MKIGVPIKGITRIAKSVLRDDFSFIIGDRKVTCDRVIANFISPSVSNIHSSDPTVDHFLVSTSDESTAFSLIESLVTSGEATFSLDHSSVVSDVLHQLGNQSLVAEIFNNFTRSEYETESILEDLQFWGNFGELNKNMVNFAASHFYELQNSIETNFPLTILTHVLSSPKLVVVSESSLFSFIMNQVRDREDHPTFLFNFVSLVYLNSQEIKEMFEFISLDDIDDNLWESIKSRLAIDISSLVDDEESTSRYFQPENNVYVFEPDGDNIFDGIFTFLNRQSGGNCIDNGTVNVIHSPPFGNEVVSCLVDYSDFSNHSHWAFKNGEKFIIFDFRSNKVNVTHYSLHSRSDFGKYFNQLKSWSLEGSNDLENWNIIDWKTNCEKLHDRDAKILCPCICKSDDYRYIRLIPTGNDWSNNEVNVFTGIELFGELIYDS